MTSRPELIARNVAAFGPRLIDPDHFVAPKFVLAVGATVGFRRRFKRLAARG
jgi:hypothetical protein